MVGWRKTSYQASPVDGYEVNGWIEGGLFKGKWAFRRDISPVGDVFDTLLSRTRLFFRYSFADKRQGWGFNEHRHLERDTG
jgi:hypothetical protein